MRSDPALAEAAATYGDELLGNQRRHHAADILCEFGLAGVAMVVVAPAAVSHARTEPDYP